MSAEFPPKVNGDINEPLTFERFSQQPEYIGVNRDLMQRFALFLPDGFYCVDVATGTGMGPKLLIEESQKTGKKGKVFGIDPNTTSLDIARRTIQPSENVSVELIEGFGQNLGTLLQGRIPEDGVDGVSILDAFHEIPEDSKISVLSAMATILRPGGVLAMNSAFTTYGMNPAPRAWGEWKLAAFEILQDTKDRDKNKKPIKIYKPEEYRQMIVDAGLNVIYEKPNFVGLSKDDIARMTNEERNVVNLSKAALIGISLYPKFIEGVFGDMKGQDSFSPREKSDALIKALEGVVSIPRGWWEIIAQKPADAKPALA